MKRTLAIIVSFFVFIFVFDTTACAIDGSLSAQAYVLYCVENDTVVLSKNAQEQMKMASTTKIMTALLALEYAQEDDRLVTFDESMMAEGSSMYLKVGDTVHLSDLAVGMMMASGNDAANAAAITIGGSVENFAKIMNSRAEKIGMTNTNFVTPSGLDDDNHYSTALDMAKLMAYALNNEKFAEITGNTTMTVDFLTPRKQVAYNNHNRLLSLYEYCIGGKTGYTKASGRCLVSAARKDGLTFVAVTLNAPSDWNDHIALYNYGFEHYCALDFSEYDDSLSVDVVGSEKSSVGLYTNENCLIIAEKETADRIKRTVYLPSFVYAPVKKGDFVGMVVFTLDDKVVKTYDLFISENIDRQEQSAFARFMALFFN